MQPSEESVIARTTTPQRLSAYQWFAVAVACAAWLFDNVGQRLFSLGRIPALASLLHAPGPDLAVQSAAKWATAYFLLGWGVGGLILGVLGDRFGRAKLLTISVLLYSLCTGATALSRTAWDFSVLRFATGVGIGGVFGLAVALISETVPDRARLAALSWLQILSTVGNVGAALISFGVDAVAQARGVPVSQSWRWLFWAGAAPAALALLWAPWLRESELWLRKRREARGAGGIAQLLAQLVNGQQARRNLLIGCLLCIAGVVGLWGIGEYAVDLQDAVFTRFYAAAGPLAAQKVASAKNLAYVLQMSGGALGMVLFARAADRYGRRPAFIAGFSAALISTVLTYWLLNSPGEAYWMMPVMGAGQLSVFAGFSIYLPELFATRCRSTGVSVAYNLGRFAAAGGSLLSAGLASGVFGHFAEPLPLRYSAMSMCVVFLLGVTAALFAPETKGKPLPD